MLQAEEKMSLKEKSYSRRGVKKDIISSRTKFNIPVILVSVNKINTPVGRKKSN